VRHNLVPDPPIHRLRVRADLRGQVFDGHVDGQDRGAQAVVSHSALLPAGTFQDVSRDVSPRWDVTEDPWKRGAAVLRPAVFLWQIAADLWHDGQWVFAQPTGKPTDPRADYSEWKAVLKAAGVREARLHDARHTAATFLLVLGIGERAVMDVMGWSRSRWLSATSTCPTRSGAASPRSSVGCSGRGQETTTESRRRPRSYARRSPNETGTETECDQGVSRKRRLPGQRRAAKGARTPDLLFTRQMLYQLSYSGLTPKAPHRVYRALVMILPRGTIPSSRPLWRNVVHATATVDTPASMVRAERVERGGGS
jgi:hypothetical protein